MARTLSTIGMALALFLVCSCSAFLTNVKSQKTSLDSEVLSFQYRGYKQYISQEDVLYAIEASLHKSTGVSDKRRLNRSGTISEVRGRTGYNSCNSDDCLLEVVFVNGKHYATSKIETLTKQILYIPVSFKRDGDLLSVKVELPNQIEVREDSGSFLQRFEPMMPLADVEQIIQSMTNISPVVQSEVTIKGEFEVDLSNAVVLDNLKRAYRFKGETYDGKKEFSKFSVNLLNSRIGSVVQYSFKQQYFLKPNGTNTFDLKKAEEFEKELRKVAKR